MVIILFSLSPLPLGEVLKLFIPVMSIYHQYVGSHSHAYDVSILLSLCIQTNFIT